MASRNAALVRIAADWRWDSVDHSCAVAVPVGAGIVGPAVNLHQLCEVHIRAPRFLYGCNVGPESIGCDLAPSLYAVAHVADKFIGASCVTFAHKVRDY